MKTLLVLTLALVCCLRAPGNDRELLASAVAAHKATLDSIMTFSCKTRLTYDPPVAGGDEQSEYWRSGLDFRCVARNKVVKTDYCYKDGVARFTTYHPGTGGQFSPTEGEVNPERIPSRCDPWAYCLVSVYGSKDHRISVPELIQQPHTLNAVKREGDGKNSRVVVDLTHERARLRLWFNPSVNYLLDRVVINLDDPDGNGSEGVHTVDRFYEPVAGHYFPQHVTIKISDKKTGKLKQTISVELSEIKINQPLPVDALLFRFPPNLLVADAVNKRMVRTDAAGEPTRQAVTKNGEPLKFGTGDAVPLPTTTATVGRATSDEPVPAGRWILPVSVGLLVVGSVIWVVRRVSSSRSSKPPASQPE